MSEPVRTMNQTSLQSLWTMGVMNFWHNSELCLFIFCYFQNIAVRCSGSHVRTMRTAKFFYTSLWPAMWGHELFGIN